MMSTCIYLLIFIALPTVQVLKNLGVCGDFPFVATKFGMFFFFRDILALEAPMKNTTIQTSSMPGGNRRRSTRSRSRIEVPNMQFNYN